MDETPDRRIGVAVMSRVMCLEPGCNETVELPADGAVAVAPEILPPREREVEIMCAKGHRNLYVLTD
jgi:hypothetical protein